MDATFLIAAIGLLALAFVAFESVRAYAMLGLAWLALSLLWLITAVLYGIAWCFDQIQRRA